MKSLAFLTACACAVVAWGIVQEQQPQPKIQAAAVAAPDAKAQDARPDIQVQDEEEISPLRIFMRKKLQSSNRILEGLLVDNLKMVSEGADELLDISSAERWRASNDMMYLQHSDEFRTSVRKLRDKAKTGSLDGSALAWVDVTMNCLHCHEWVRNTIIAEGPDTSPTR